MENKVYLLTTQTCSYCPMVKSMIEAKGLDITYVDIEETPDLAIQTGVMSVPTIVVDDNGELTPHVGQQACLQFINS